MAKSESPRRTRPDFNIYRTVAKNQLIHLLESIGEPKDLMLDDELMRPLDRIIGASVLKEHGVSAIYKLEKGNLLQGCFNRLYLFRPSVKNAAMIAAQIRADQAAEKDRSYRLVMTPRRSVLCEKILEREGVYGAVSFDEFPLEFLCLDDDILSMEYNPFFREYFVENNFSFFQTLANALMTFEGLFGKFQSVHTVGRCANVIYGMKQKLQEVYGHEASHRVESEVGTLILIDRDVDYTSAVLSPLTYEGLLDDHMGISSGTVDFEASMVGQAKSIKWILNSQDEVFKDIRDRHFATVFTHLSSKAKEIQSIYNRKNDMKTVSDMRTFVSKHLKGTSSQHRSLGLHIAACESIMQHKSSTGDFENQLRTEHNLLQGFDMKFCQQFIEDSILRCFPMVYVLRLMCLYSLTWGGIPTRLFQQWKNDFLQSYGYQHLLTFHNLRKAGLLVEQDSSSTVSLPKIGVRKSRFAGVAKLLNLLPSRQNECDLRNPTDVSYLYNGSYTPLTYRLVEQLLLADRIPGLNEALRNFSYAYHTQEVRNIGPYSDKNVLVFFLGGCSYSELAALRMLGRSLEINIVVASTSFFGGEKFLKSLA